MYQTDDRLFRLKVSKYVQMCFLHQREQIWIIYSELSIPTKIPEISSFEPINLSNSIVVSKLKLILRLR